MVLQCATVSAFISPIDTFAQRKSINDIYISVDAENKKIIDIMKIIEHNSVFNFTYNDSNIDINNRITIAAHNKSLANVLEEIARKANLKFKRINNNIHVSKSDFSSSLQPSLVEEENYEIVVHGKVYSEGENLPLPGVNIVVKGTLEGTTSDTNGEYTITVPSEESVLIFSYIGYEDHEVAVGNQTEINVHLIPDITTLSEVVVVGYGTQERKEITSAVVSLDSENFNKGNVNDVAQLLQGKVAGLTVVRAGANPNGSFQIRLRGLSTVGQNTSPLIVIDGVVGADLNSVDPNDIATFDILKDGSAAAIYGTRGSQGVILITTKQGVAGKVQIDYNGYVTSEQVSRTTQVMTADEWREFGMPGNDFGGNTDWLDEITQTAISHTHNLSLSGGSAGMSYRASVNYRNGEGVLLTTGFKQLNTRLNLSQKALNDRLTMTLNISHTSRESDLGFADAFRNAPIFNPTAPVFSDDPQMGQPFGGYFQNTAILGLNNPVAILEQNTANRELKRLNLNLQAELEILDGLRILGRFAQERSNNFFSEYISKESLFGDGRNRDGLAEKIDDEAFNQLFESTLTYDFSPVNRLDVSMLAGYSYQEFQFQGFSAEGGDFLTDAFRSNNFGSSLDFDNGLGNVNSYKNESKLVAFFGRINVNYQDTYFLSASLRREGSTKFGANNKWGSFPALSAGVNIGNLVDISFVKNLKLRASYGVTGSVPNNNFLSITTFTPSGTFLVNGEFVPGFGPDKNTNPDLKWEKKEEFDIGMDFSIFDGKFNGSFDYFNRTTNDLIWLANVPQPPNITPNTWINVGELKSSGIEIAMRYDVMKKGDFSWTTGVNFSTFDIELVSLSNEIFQAEEIQLGNLGAPGQNGDNIVRIREGDKLGLIHGPIYEGVSESGEWVFSDVDGDGTYEDEEDEVILGNAFPDFDFGINNTFTYRNFDFNFFLRGSIGHDLVNTMRAFYEVPEVALRFNIVNTKYFDPSLAPTTAARFSSLHVENASFMKLDNLTLGYNMPMNDESAVRSVRFYISGQNLFTITDYTGVDPEVRYVDAADNNNILAPGLERRNDWARTRSFTLGVNIGL